jgi:ABC-type dipeptide/oligopeptide/nickel transport system ATPase component
VRTRQADLLFYSADSPIPLSLPTASGKHSSAMSSDCVVGEAVGRWRVNTANTAGEYSEDHCHRRSACGLTISLVFAPLRTGAYAADIVGTKRLYNASTGVVIKTTAVTRGIAVWTPANADGTIHECHPGSWSTKEYTGPYGCTINTIEEADFFEPFGGYPKQLYMREEFARVFEIITSAVTGTPSGGSCLPQLGVMGSVGVGKSVSLLSVCLHLWRNQGRSVFIVRRFNKQDRPGRGSNPVLGYYPSDQYAVLLLGASGGPGCVSIVDTIPEAQQLYRSSAASCAAGHILAVDDRVEGEGTWRSICTAQYFLYTRSDLRITMWCKPAVSVTSSAPTAVIKPLVPTGQAATGVYVEPTALADMILLPGWALPDLQATAPLTDATEAGWRHYAGGGSLSVFQEDTAYLEERTAEQVDRIRTRGVNSVDELTERQLSILSRLYVADIHTAGSYTDRQNWLMLFDVGLALPGIAHVLSVDAMKASLEMAIKLRQPSWIEGAMCGYMHQLAREGRLKVTLQPCEPDGTPLPSADDLVLVTAGCRFEATCDRYSDCVDYLCFTVSGEGHSSDTRYWHPIRWVDGPIHAVLCCPTQKIVVLLRCAPLGPVVIEKAERLRRVLEMVGDAAPAGSGVVFAAVVPEEYCEYGEKVSFVAKTGQELPQGKYCVGTFSPT